MVIRFAGGMGREGDRTRVLRRGTGKEGGGECWDLLAVERCTRHGVRGSAVCDRPRLGRVLKLIQIILSKHSRNGNGRAYLGTETLKTIPSGDDESLSSIISVSLSFSSKGLGLGDFRFQSGRAYDLVTIDTIGRLERP